MFITALFTIARTWKQPRCPLADEWVRKLLYIHTVEYYSIVKKNTFESVLMKWMKLEPIIQSEVSQKEKHQYSILTHIYGIKKTVMTILYARQQKRHRCKEQTFGLCGQRRVWDDLREQHWNMYNTICKIDDQCKFDAWNGTQSRCSGTTQRDGEGRESGEGVQDGDTCTPVADSCWCMAKPRQYCRVISLQLK